jgi:hypothetical protein
MYFYIKPRWSHETIFALSLAQRLVLIVNTERHLDSLARRSKWCYLSQVFIGLLACFFRLVVHAPDHLVHAFVLNDDRLIARLTSMGCPAWFVYSSMIVLTGRVEETNYFADGLILRCVSVAYTTCTWGKNHEPVLKLTIYGDYHWNFTHAIWTLIVTVGLAFMARFLVIFLFGRSRIVAVGSAQRFVASSMKRKWIEPRARMILGEEDTHFLCSSPQCALFCR